MSGIDTSHLACLGSSLRTPNCTARTLDSSRELPGKESKFVLMGELDDLPTWLESWNSLSIKLRFSRWFGNSSEGSRVHTCTYMYMLIYVSRVAQLGQVNSPHSAG